MYDALGNRDEYEFAMLRWDTVPGFTLKAIPEKERRMAVERARAHSLAVEKVRAAVQRARARRKPSLEPLAEVVRDPLISRDLIATCLVERAKRGNPKFLKLSDPERRARTPTHDAADYMPLTDDIVRKFYPNQRAENRKIRVSKAVSQRTGGVVSWKTLKNYYYGQGAKNRRRVSPL